MIRVYSSSIPEEQMKIYAAEPTIFSSQPTAAPTHFEHHFFDGEGRDLIFS